MLLFSCSKTVVVFSLDFASTRGAQTLQANSIHFNSWGADPNKLCNLSVINVCSTEKKKVNITRSQSNLNMTLFEMYRRMCRSKCCQESFWIIAGRCTKFLYTWNRNSLFPPVTESLYLFYVFTVFCHA